MRSLWPSCLNPLLTHGMGHPLLKSLYLLTLGYLCTQILKAQLNGVMIGVGYIQMSHLCSRKKVRPFTIWHKPCLVVPLQSPSLSSILPHEYIALVYPKSTRPRWSNALRKAYIMLNGFKSPLFFSVEDKISSKSPMHTHGREARSFRCHSRCHVSHFVWSSGWP